MWQPPMWLPAHAAAMGERVGDLGEGHGIAPPTSAVLSTRLNCACVAQPSYANPSGCGPNA
jgi:hypothetical protein